MLELALVVSETCQKSLTELYTINTTRNYYSQLLLLHPTVQVVWLGPQKITTKCWNWHFLQIRYP